MVKFKIVGAYSKSALESEIESCIRDFYKECLSAEDFEEFNISLQINEESNGGAFTAYVLLNTDCNSMVEVRYFYL